MGNKCIPTSGDLQSVTEVGDKNRMKVVWHRCKRKVLASVLVVLLAQETEEYGFGAAMGQESFVVLMLGAS
jgi:hypothetical protein